MHFLFLSPTNDSVDILRLNKAARHFASCWGPCLQSWKQPKHPKRHDESNYGVSDKTDHFTPLKSFCEEYFMMWENAHNLMTEQVRVMVENIGFRLCSQISLHPRVSSDTF